MNANDRQKISSKNTALEDMTYQSKANNYLILPALKKTKTDQSTPTTSNFYRRNNCFVSHLCVPSMNNKRKVQSTNFAYQLDNETDQEHQCYVCQEQFLSQNDFEQHLCQKCYPSEMREQIENLTPCIEDNEQRKQLEQVLWKHGKLFNIRKPPITKLNDEPMKEEIQQDELLNNNYTVESVYGLDERTTVNDILGLYEPNSNVVLSVHEQTNVLDGLEAVSEEDEQQQPIQNSILINKEIQRTAEYHSTSAKNESN
ncbi:unnamed protein product [Rotaria sp. Silwood2]|nr:unnamed protein product [Rotaria sp. Silwood2]CAF3386178.1 unnamed protein product [Rotaria sp. Silwood2]CAF4359601.1 unnamed protein product [Rotaria sp. Silwood2]CAF4469532.1 unnamed protein product [Rotaria sp. Silwood2]